MGGGGMLPRSIGGAAGMLGLEMPLLNAHPQQQQQQQQYVSPFQQPQNQQLAGHHSSLRQSSYASYGVRGRQQQAQHSPEGEPEFREGGGAGDHGAAKRGGASLTSQSPCPWTRMKWTDSMVRLLISVVYSVGDDGGGGEGGDHNNIQLPPPASSSSSSRGANTRGGGAASASASASQQQQQQKKGKWKSVSRAMMEKGFCVSPQQCEDKFNDLNKRYKRVIDLLGKGTACRVVENPSLLDTMDHLPAKAREEARKLLSSKHLFFPEMCAYHNAGSANPSCAAGPPAAPAAQPSRMPSLPQLSDRQTSCFHHPAGPGASREEEAIGKAAAAGANDGRHHQPAEEDEDEDEGEDNDADEDRSNNEEEEEEDEEEEDDDDRLADDDPLEDDRNEEDRGGDVEDMKAVVTASKRQKRTPRLSLSLQSSTTASARLQELRSELMGMAAAAAAAGEGGGGAMMQWVRRRAAELEEQRVGYQCRAFQLERQRFKWLRFSTNKEHEMERMKLDNDRLRLDNDRMLLLLRQKELELLSTTASDAAGGHAAAASSTDHHHFLNHHKQQE
ncbi:hypothetical protein ACMD2_19757 [Ananas comosus]|nr:hypothetical protein ACMD2_19757 [Ananas comosus]CAD1836717.1 unnamed protein product [Ananas comosus var. bracteatus]